MIKLVHTLGKKYAVFAVFEDGLARWQNERLRPYCLGYSRRHGPEHKRHHHDSWFMRQLRPVLCMFSSPQILGLWYQWPESFTRYQCPYIGSGRFGSSRERCVNQFCDVWWWDGYVIQKLYNIVVKELPFDVASLLWLRTSPSVLSPEKKGFLFWKGLFDLIFDPFISFSIYEHTRATNHFYGLIILFLGL